MLTGRRQVWAILGQGLVSKSTILKWICSAALAFSGAMALGRSVFAAELLLPAGPSVRPAFITRGCGPCGCLRVTYVHHREIRTTYGVGFDPRNYDQTELHFYPGPVRRYPRYWVCVDPAW